MATTLATRFRWTVYGQLFGMARGLIRNAEKVLVMQHSEQYTTLKAGSFGAITRKSNNPHVFTWLLLRLPWAVVGACLAAYVAVGGAALFLVEWPLRMLLRQGWRRVRARHDATATFTTPIE